MNAPVLAALLVTAACTAALVWLQVRGLAQAKNLDGIAKRLSSSPGPTPPAPAADHTMIERHVAFDHYDPEGGAPIPHLVCMAMQDVVLEAEINGFICTKTPTVFVMHSIRRIHVLLPVARPATSALEEETK